jgi:metal-sulfur cluster biosynthetic enzyme
MNGKVKENANPVVHQIDPGRANKKKHNVEWCPLDKWNLPVTSQQQQQQQQQQLPPILGLLPVQRLYTAQDRNIHTALLEISKATHGKGISLLTDTGLVLHDDSEDDAATVAATTTTTSHHPSSQPTVIVTTPTTSTQQQQQRRRHRRDKYTVEEIFDIIANIQDPEHPLTLAQLNVVNKNHIVVHDNHHNNNNQQNPEAMSMMMLSSLVTVRFTPTIPHCSMATLIGLAIRVKLLRSLPPRFKVKVEIQPGTHASEVAVGKQLADKERVCAALENQHLLGVVNKCIGDGMNMTM